MSTGRIALYGGGGAPYHHAAIYARSGHEIDFVFPTDILAGALEGFDAFVMPGGGYRAMQGQIEPLGSAGARAIRDYVDAGGLYVGCCAGSYDAAVAAESFVRICPAQREMCLLQARVWNEGDTEWVGLQSPGIGVLNARTVAPQHPVMEGMPPSFEIAHYNGPFFKGADELAHVAGPTERFTPSERFLGPRAGATLVDEAAQAGVANIVAGSHGCGRVLLFGSHPEFGFTIAMDDEQAPARMLLNAIEWQLDERGSPARPDVDLFSRRTEAAERAEEDLERLPGLVARIRERCGDLRAREDVPRWLEPAFALSFFGLEPADIWAESLDAIDRLAAEAERRAPNVEPRVLSFRPLPEWAVDGGYHGVVPLLEQADQLLGEAIAGWEVDLGEPTANPYEHVLTSPYYLVAGSYLAAVGRVTAATLLCRTYERVAA